MIWNEAEHPRDLATGEFTETHSGWLRRAAEQLGDTTGAPDRTWPTGLADRLRDEHPGLKLNIARNGSGHVILSAIVVPERSKGLGTKIMNEITELADRYGDTIGLTPSADFGGSKARLVKFYGRFGFRPNKGRSRDYAISETMIREPR